MNKIAAEDFWKVFLESAPEPAPVFFRLYYNTDGSPVCYSMEDLPGNYIEVDRETYLTGSHNVRVVDQKIVQLSTVGASKKLRPNSVTGTACDPRDICVVVEENHPHVKWSLQ